MPLIAPSPSCSSCSSSPSSHYIVGVDPGACLQSLRTEGSPPGVPGRRERRDRLLEGLLGGGRQVVRYGEVGGVVGGQAGLALAVQSSELSLQLVSKIQN